MLSFNICASARIPKITMLFVCCLDGVYKWQTDQCLENSTFQKDVKTTCGNSKF